MPYIDKRRRDLIVFPENCGELNYMITELVVVYLRHNGLSYQTCNDIVGALDNAKDEFRRRVQHKYEDKKIKENGDVYEE
jgi:hypothetical protein